MKSAKQKCSRAADLFRQAELAEDRGDFKSAFELLLASARLGDPGSQLNLGNFYSWGKGTQRNLDEAARWYKRSYQGGYSTGALNLGIDRRNQGRAKSAVLWLKKAVAMNDGEAAIELAKIYKGRKRGRKTAAKLLRRALRMNRDHISDAAKEQGESLLRGLEI